MVEGNSPDQYIVDFSTSESLTDNIMEGLDSNLVATNGIDWIKILSTIKKFLDPEEEYQKAKKRSEEFRKTLEGEKLEKYIKLFCDEKKMRKEAKNSTLFQNLISSTKYLAVVEFAEVIFAQNKRFYFKKGSTLYNFEGKVFWRKQDVLKQDFSVGSNDNTQVDITGDISFKDLRF